MPPPDSLAGTFGYERIGRSALSPLWWLYLPIVALVALIAAHYFAPAWTFAWLRSEHGVLENAQFALIALTSLLGFRLLSFSAVRSNGWLRAWVLCAAVGSFYIAGEEISWGQHAFGWSTPDSIGAINDQNETNLHNVSIWFNGVPLTILEIGVFLGGIVLPLVVRRRPALAQVRWAIIWPSIRGLPCAAIAIAIRVLKNILVHAQGMDFPLSARAGELEELFLYGFMLIYLVELRQRLVDG